MSRPTRGAVRHMGWGSPKIRNFPARFVCGTCDAATRFGCEIRSRDVAHTPLASRKWHCAAYALIGKSTLGVKLVSGVAVPLTLVNRFFESEASPPWTHSLEEYGTLPLQLPIWHQRRKAPFPPEKGGRFLHRVNGAAP